MYRIQIMNGLVGLFRFCALSELNQYLKNENWDPENRDFWDFILGYFVTCIGDFFQKSALI